MTKFLTAVAFLALASSVAPAEDVAFHRTQVVDARNHATQAELIFSSSARRISVRVADRVLAEIPYSAIDKMSYEFSKHHRIKEGAIVMVASLGAGGVVMLTQSKSHWLYVDYKENGVPKTLVVRMHKKNYKDILLTAREQTGKEVQFSRDAKLKL